MGPNHLRNSFHQKGKCIINGCKETHHQLWHEDAVVQKVEDKNQPVDESKSSTQTEGSSVGGLGSTTEQFNTTMESQRTLVMALQTVSVKLRNGHWEITVNALLDDGSKESYINSDVAAELVLDGLVETATVSTMNRNVMTFQTTSVECETRSIDGKVEYNVSTYTTQKVTGKMRPIEWRVHG